MHIIDAEEIDELVATKSAGYSDIYIATKQAELDMIAACTEGLKLSQEQSLKWRYSGIPEMPYYGYLGIGTEAYPIGLRVMELGRGSLSRDFKANSLDFNSLVVVHSSQLTFLKYQNDLLLLASSLSRRLKHDGMEAQICAYHSDFALIKERDRTFDVKLISDQYKKQHAFERGPVYCAPFTDDTEDVFSI